MEEPNLMPFNVLRIFIISVTKNTDKRHFKFSNELIIEFVNIGVYIVGFTSKAKNLFSI